MPSLRKAKKLLIVIKEGNSYIFGNRIKVRHDILNPLHIGQNIWWIISYFNSYYKCSCITGIHIMRTIIYTHTVVNRWERSSISHIFGKLSSNPLVQCFGKSVPTNGLNFIPRSN